MKNIQTRLHIEKASYNGKTKFEGNEILKILDIPQDQIPITKMWF